MPAAALAVGQGEPELEELVEQVVLARAEVDGVEAGVADEAFDGLAVGLVGGVEEVGHDAVEDGIGEVLPAERVEGAGVAGGGREDGELGGAVRGTLAELVGGVDDDLARELVGVVAGEVRDGLAGNADDHGFGAVEGLAHRFLGRARPVADLVSGRGERLTQRPADLACADDCDVHQISFAFPRVLPETGQARWRCINGPHLVALVRGGAIFVKGKLVRMTRPREGGLSLWSAAAGVCSHRKVSRITGYSRSVLRWYFA